jgi:transmembrane sensor
MTRRLEPAEKAAARLGAEGLTPNERASLWMRIEASRDARRSHLRPFALGGLAFASIGALAVLIFSIAGRKPASDVQAACRLDPSGVVMELPESCEAQSVRVGDDDWRLTPGAKLSRSKTGPVVESGSVEFRVAPRSRAHFQVHVAGNTIRVLGTVFRIHQQGAEGSVSVSEGVIEFVWRDGSSERVAASQTLVWPRRAAARPGPTDDGKQRPAPPRDAVSDRDKPAKPGENGKTQAGAPRNLESVMDRVLQLKSQRRYGELVALLEETLGSGKVAGGQRERLNYELGLALEGAGRNPCAHWKRHVKAYGMGRHGGALEKRLERCD